MIRLLQGFDGREVIVSTLVFYITAFGLNFATLKISTFTFEENANYYQKINLDFTHDRTKQTIQAKVDKLKNNQDLALVDFQLTCSDKLCNIEASSKYNSPLPSKTRDFLNLAIVRL